MRLSLNAYWKLQKIMFEDQTSNKIISIAINNFYNLLISRGNKLVKVKFALIQPTSIWTRI